MDDRTKNPTLFDLGVDYDELEQCFWSAYFRHVGAKAPPLTCSKPVTGRMKCSEPNVQYPDPAQDRAAERLPR